MSGNYNRSDGYTHKNKVELIQGGSDYFHLLEELIDRAQYTIHIQMYIFDDDITGSQIAEALIRASKRNVKVYLLLDGYASQFISKVFIKKLKDAGVHFRYFQPLLKSDHFYFGRRMHQKTIVIDSYYALVGGINIAGRYNEVDGIAPWLDFSVYVEGEVADKLCLLCQEFWKSVNNETCKMPEYYKNLLDKILEDERCSIRIRRNDWVKRHNEIWKTYFNLFNQANESITIMCSYFLPGRILRHRLSVAAKKGIKVRVILAGQSDIKISKYAERYLYQWMLQNNIEIYEYQRSILHAKLAVIDNHWVTIGSFNINNISAYASVELNLDIRNKPFASQVYQRMEEIINNDCIKITLNNFTANATRFKRVVQKSAYELIRVILNLSTFYFKPE